MRLLSGDGGDGPAHRPARGAAGREDQACPQGLGGRGHRRALRVPLRGMGGDIEGRGIGSGRQAVSDPMGLEDGREL